MNRGGEKILYWLTPALALTWLFTFLVFPDFVDPLPPTASAEEVAQYYRDPDNITRIRLTMIVFNWFSIGIIPFLALIAMEIRRMKHSTPVFELCFLGVIAAAPTMLFIADLFWLLAVFRPERDPQLTQMFHDIAWVSFTGQVGFLIAQNIFLAAAIWLDRSAQRVFRPWVAWFNLLIAACLAPAAFVATSLEGPLAWDGVLSFNLRNSAIIIWIVVMALVLGGSLKRGRQNAELAA